MRLLFMPHGHTAQTHPHLLGQILQGGAGAGVQSHPAVRHRDEFRHEQASDESVVAGGVRLVRLH